MTDTAWDRLTHPDYGLEHPQRRPPRLVIRPAAPSELAVWRQWATDGVLPQVAVEILGALLAELGEQESAS